jgi:ubiquinone/menaquinone biosynthesis C-methylase UbiE
MAGEARDDTAAAIGDVARAVANGGPSPRGLPYFGLDHASGTRLGLLDELAAHGIFRKYEHVLDLGGGLGASTRYLASRLGCTATATGSAAEARGGRLLTERVGLDRKVSHVAADAPRLPFADAAFTHVWVVEALARLGPRDVVLAEAARVLRPGGHFGVQELVRDGADDRVRQALEAVGIREVSVRDVTARAREHGSRQEIARAQLERRLGAAHPFVRERRAIEEALAAGRLRVVQLMGRRP